MNDLETAKKIVVLLAEKKKLFEQFESVTGQMMTDSFDEIDGMLGCVDQRESLIGKIDELDRKIQTTAAQSENGELMLRASKNLCDFSALEPGYREIYLAGQALFGIISRIMDADPQINRNMETMMNELQHRIRENKKKSKFTGYINTMGIQASKGALYDKKK